MDETTLRSYDTQAQIYSQEWLQQPPPDDMYTLFKRFLTPGGSTADIGCGNGRDVNWLNLNGFPAVGFDASAGLLREARSLFPRWSFHYTRLPELAEVQGPFVNVVCETVLMHLPVAELRPAVQALDNLLCPSGILYLSWRVSTVETRHPDGRLYSSFEAQSVLDALRDMQTLMFEEVTSQSSGRVICRYLGQKSPY